jgi:hypothetical protein
MPKLQDLRGQRFGRLTPTEWVVHPTQLPARGIMRGIWECRCDCGNKTRVDSFQLTAGKVRSCGCLFRDGLHRVARSTDGRFKEWGATQQ